MLQIGHFFSIFVSPPPPLEPPMNGEVTLRLPRLTINVLYFYDKGEGEIYSRSFLWSLFQKMVNFWPLALNILLIQYICCAGVEPTIEILVTWLTKNSQGKALMHHVGSFLNQTPKSHETMQVQLFKPLICCWCRRAYQNGVDNTTPHLASERQFALFANSPCQPLSFICMMCGCQKIT